jgi:probable HAF family extracellular repeat protein
MKSSVIVALAAAAVAACGSGAGPTAPDAALGVDLSPLQYQEISLGTLGGNGSFALDVNNNNQVVGYSYTTPDDFGTVHAFLWENGLMQDLGTLGGTESIATEINQRGQVLGWSTTSDGAVHAFVWDRGALQDLGPVRTGRWARNRWIVGDINDVGQVVASRPSGEPFLWQDGVTQTLPLNDAAAINNHGQVAGSVARPDSAGTLHHRAAIWEDGVVTELADPGDGRDSWATAISNNGWVAGKLRGLEEFYPGFWAVADHPARWRQGVLEDLGKPKWNEFSWITLRVADDGKVLVRLGPYYDTYVRGDGAWQWIGQVYATYMNRGGVVAGGGGPERSGAFLWQHGLRQRLGDSQWDDALAVNESGVAVGSADDVAVMWAPVLAAVAGALP